MFTTPPRRMEGKSENCSFATEARIMLHTEKTRTPANPTGSLSAQRNPPSRERKITRVSQN
jgi:hypothetical protein